MKKNYKSLLVIAAVLLVGNACSKNESGSNSKIDSALGLERNSGTQKISKDYLIGYTMADNSLHASINVSTERNVSLYERFAMMYEANPYKTQEWYEKAQKVRAKADDLFNYIQNFKNDLVILADGQAGFDKAVAAGLDPTRNIQNSSNLEITGRYGLEQGNAIILKDNVAEYCECLTRMLSYRNEALRNTIQTTLATKGEYSERAREYVDWEVAMFDGMPVGATMAMLTKMQNDVRTTEGLVVQHLMDQTDAGDVRVNRLNAYVIPKSNVVIRGGMYSAQIILAAMDTTQFLDYYVDGAKINNNGRYEVPATGVGKKRYSGWIEIQDPSTGEIDRAPFSGEYSVVEPSLSISNVDMNIMYRGYDNKFAISVPGVSNDKVHISASGAAMRQQGGLWIIKPNDNAKQVTITAQAEVDGKMQSIGSQQYRVKQLPAPSVFFSAHGKEYPTGNIAPSVLSDPSGTIVVSYGPEGVLDIPLKVTSFKTYVGSQLLTANGNKFTKAQLDQITKLKKGQPVIIQDVRAMGPNGKEFKLPPLVLTID